MKKVKGISLSVRGTEVSYNKGYLIRDSPFVKIKKFVDGDSSISADEIRKLIRAIPHPDRHETHIGLVELELLKKTWSILDGKKLEN